MLKTIKTLSFASVIAVMSCTPTTNPHFKVGNPYTVDGKQYFPNINPKYAEIGMASWYGNGDGFHNELTANGELFDKDDMTAAHKTLPLPSIVTVTNLENGKTEKLRVNDRGPFVSGRIIDVSEKAAKKLGFHSKGSAKVLVEIDKEGSLKAIENIRIKQDEKDKIIAAYNGGPKYVEPINPSSNKDMGIITTALNEQQSKPRSMMTKKEIVEKETVEKSSPVQKVEKIVIRDEIVKPEGVTVASSSTDYNKVPKSMPNAAPKDYSYNTSGAEKGIYIQVASLNDYSKASDVSRGVGRFASSKIVDAVVNGKQYYRVRLGSFSNRAEAETALNNVKNSGYSDAYIIAEK